MRRAVLILSIALMACGCATKKTTRLQNDEIRAEVSVRSSLTVSDSLLRLRRLVLDSLSVVIERDSLGERITLRARRATLADTTSRQTRMAAERTDTLSRHERRREQTSTCTARRFPPWLLLALWLVLVIVALRSLRSLKSLE